jgi:hypothetical protein
LQLFCLVRTEPNVVFHIENGDEPSHSANIPLRSKIVIKYN